MAAGFPGNPYDRVSKWLLTSPELDTQVRSPFEARVVNIDRGGATDDIGSPLDAQLSSRRRASAPTRIDVVAEWRAEHGLDDIRPAAKDLEKLFDHNGELGRPPRVVFQWGGIVQLSGVISELRIDWRDGVYKTPPYYPYAFEASFVVSRQLSRTFEQTTRFARETANVTVGRGQSFESLAMRRFGDPYLGILIQRSNPGISLFGLQPGDTVRIYDETHPSMQQSIEPRSPALLGDVSTLLQQFAEERLSKRGANLEDLGL